MKLNQIKDSVKNRLMPYIESGVIESLDRNRHMNDYDGEQVSNQQVIDMITQLIDRSNFTSQRAVDVLGALVKSAKIMRTSVTNLQQNTIDAVLVDFINYAGITCCVDYGLYTVDLSK